MPVNKDLSGWFWAGLGFGTLRFISMGTSGAYKLSPEDVFVELQPDAEVHGRVAARAFPVVASIQL